MILDNDKPSLIEDLTSKNPTTGERFSFIVSMEDNIGIKDIWVVYRINGGPYSNLSMDDGMPSELSVEIPSNGVYLEYYIIASDFSMNWFMGTASNLTIMDNDAPMILGIIVPEIAFSGDEISIYVSAVDNIRISDIFLEYWYNNGQHFNISCDDGTDYGFQVNIPHDIEGELYYIVHIADEAENIFSSDIRYLGIQDRISPKNPALDYPDTGYTGNEFELVISTKDNIGIHMIKLAYKMGEGEFEEVMFRNTNNVTHIIDIPHNEKGPLVFFVEVEDISGNNITTTVRSVDIEDDDPPILKQDLTPKEVAMGEVLELVFRAEDNIKVQNFYLVVDIQDKDEYILESENGLYIHTIQTHDRMKDLTYRTIIRDPSGNEFTSNIKRVWIIDNVPPKIIGPHFLEVEKGEYLDIEFICEDNIDVSNHEWIGAPIQTDGYRIYGTLEKSGKYIIFLKVFDTSMNMNSTNLTIMVYNDIGDKDGDGLNDTLELELGLSPYDHSDAEKDSDGDGLSNKEEIALKTMIFDADTDNDSLPDGWEIDHGLDPRKDSSRDDSDGDGVLDIDEYLLGTDPWINEQMDEYENREKHPIIIFLMILIMLAGIAVIGKMYSRKKR
jgi:hypothetical protein